MLQTVTQGGRRRTGPACGRDVQALKERERGVGRQFYARSKYRTMVSVRTRNPAAVLGMNVVINAMPVKGRETKSMGRMPMQGFHTICDMYRLLHTAENERMKAHAMHQVRIFCCLQSLETKYSTSTTKKTIFACRTCRHAEKLVAMYPHAFLGSDDTFATCTSMRHDRVRHDRIQLLGWQRGTK